MNVNWTYCSDHFTNYTNVKSPETNVMYDNDTSIEVILLYNYTYKYNSHAHVNDTLCFMQKHYQRETLSSKQVFIVEYGCCVTLIV